MRICLISPINPRNTPYLRDTKASAHLAGLRLKYFIESSSNHRVDVIHSDVEDVYSIRYSQYDYVGVTSYEPTREFDFNFARWLRRTYRKNPPS